MPRFKLLLHDGPTTPPVVEDLDVATMDDAKDLAKVTLLMTKVYTHAVVYRGDEYVETFRRDSHPAP